MSTPQKRGLNYEHELKNEIYEVSHKKIVPIRPGWSGNSVIPMPDIHIDDGEVVHALEVKRTKDDTSFTVKEEDIAQLLRFAEQYPRRVYPYVAVRFTHRQLIMIPLWSGSRGRGLSEVIENAVTLCPVDAKVSRANNLVVKKPDTDQWPSSQKGSDAAHVIKTLSRTD